MVIESGTEENYTNNVIYESCECVHSFLLVRMNPVIYNLFALQSS
jgi:hypothetical protein